MSGERFNSHVPGTFHLANGVFFRRIERRGVEGEANGGANGNREERGIWWDVELIVCDFVTDNAESASAENPGHYEVVRRQLIDEGSWLSVVSSMGSRGEDFFTYNLAESLHTGGLR